MKVQKRRRRENKTNYTKREKLLKSEKPRIVFRKTNKYLIAQYVVSEAAQDKVLFGITSKDLLKHGWPENAKGGLKNLSASYLTGYLVGRKVLSEKWDIPVVDLGMARILHKTRIFAFIKGLIDSGLEITSKEGAFPEESRLKGEHLKNKVDVEKIMQRIGDSLRSPSKDSRTKPNPDKL